MDTVDGDLTVVLPSDVAGFEAETDAVNGGVQIKGFDDSLSSSIYTYGDGSMKITPDGVECKLIVEKETES